MKTALAGGARLAMGVDHADYSVGIEIPPESRTALLRDLAL
jgi:hypothetical protein